MILLLLLWLLLSPSPGFAGTTIAPAGSAGVSTPLTGGATSAAGQNWFFSQPPGLSPFARLNGVTANVPILCAFVNDLTITCFGGGTATGSNEVWRSNNAGQSFTAVAESAASVYGAGVIPVSMVRLSTGTYVIAAGTSATTPFFTTVDGINFTSTTSCIDCGGLGGPLSGLAVNSTTGTILATLANIPSTRLCTSATNGATWTCSTSVPGFSAVINPGNPAGSGANPNQVFANPSGSIWLAVGASATPVDIIVRSIDDGATWSTVFTAGANNNLRSVACLTSTLCLAVANQVIYRSTDAGLTWTTAVTSGPNSANTHWVAVAAFDAVTAAAVPWDGPSDQTGFRTADGGVTWAPFVLTPDAPCPTSSDTFGNQAPATVITRNGRALATFTHTAATAPCAYYASSGAGGIAIAGPLGVPWGIDLSGGGPVTQSNALIPFTVAPVQGSTLFNSQTTGAANTAIVVTIAAAANTRGHVYRTEASCSAGTSNLTVTDGGTTIWSTLAAEVTTARFRKDFTPAGLTGATNSAVVVTLAACGAGNTGTLIVHADRF